MDRDVHKEAVARFSDVMWTMQQVLFMKLDRRLAIFLTEEVLDRGTDTLRMTHDQIARHVGSAREVITRMLKYFAAEGLVETGPGHRDRDRPGGHPRPRRRGRRPGRRLPGLNDAHE